MRKFFLLILLISFFSCLRFPSQLDGKSIADCSKATIPSSYDGTDTTKVTCVIEIYDFQQRLVNYGESNLHYSIVPRDLQNGYTTTFYWSGEDLNGDVVDPGKYLMKLSAADAYDTACRCTEILVKSP
jgi:hypothetical protein